MKLKRWQFATVRIEGLGQRAVLALEADAERREYRLLSCAGSDNGHVLLVGDAQLVGEPVQPVQYKADIRTWPASAQKALSKYQFARTEALYVELSGAQTIRDARRRINLESAYEAYSQTAKKADCHNTEQVPAAVDAYHKSLLGGRRFPDPSRLSRRARRRLETKEAMRNDICEFGDNQYRTSYFTHDRWVLDYRSDTARTRARGLVSYAPTLKWRSPRSKRLSLKPNNMLELIKKLREKEKKNKAPVEEASPVEEALADDDVSF